MKPSFKILLAVTLIAHTCLVFWTAHEVNQNYTGPGYQEELQLWYIIAVIDLPISFLWVAIDHLTNEWVYAYSSDFIAQIIYPTCIYLIGGTLQWIGILFLIKLVAEKIKKKIQPESGAYLDNAR